MQEQLDEAPEFATSLGVDKGSRAHQKSELSHRSLAEVRRFEKLVANQLARLRRIDRSKLSGTDRISYDVVLYGLAQQDADNKRFDYGGGGAGGPYVISQLTGAYQSTPDLPRQPARHRDEGRCRRLSGAAGRVRPRARRGDGADAARHRAGRDAAGFHPGAGADADEQAARAQPAESSVLVASLVRRTKEKNIAGDWSTPAAKIVNDKSLSGARPPDRAGQRPAGRRGARCRRVAAAKDGDAYYRASLEQTGRPPTMSPKEIHQMGLDVVADHTAKIDAIMKAKG